MSALTYNVIITKSASLMKELFFPKNRKRTSVGRFINEINNRDLLHLSPGRQGGLIEFDFNIPPGGESGRYTKIKLVDTKEISDFFVLDRHPVNDLLINNILSSPQDRLGSSIENIFSLGNTYYVTFGTGDNIDDWSSPYLMTLNEAFLRQSKDNVRMVELLFTPSPHTINAYSDLYFNDDTYAGIESKFDKKTNTYKKLQPFSGKVTFETQGRLPKLGYRHGSFPRWNYWIRALLRKYLKSLFPTVPVDNILVLFSCNLDSYDERAPINFNDARSIPTCLDFSTKLNRFGIDIEAVTDNNPAARPIVNTTNQILKNKIPEASGATIVSYGDSATTDDPVFAAVVSDRERLETLKTLKQERNNLEEALEKQDDNWGKSVVNWFSRNVINLNQEGEAWAAALTNRVAYDETQLRVAERYGVDTKQLSAYMRRRLKQVKDNIKEEEGRAIIVNEGTYANQDAEAARLPEDMFTISMSHTVDKNTDSSDVSPLTPLFKFYKNLKSFQNKHIEFTLIEENDIKIASYLKEAGIIADATKPVILFGEKRIIRDFIYPRIPFSSEPEDKKINESYGSTLSFLGRNKNYSWIDYSTKFSQEYFTTYYKNRTSSFKEKLPKFSEFKNKISDDDLIFTHNTVNPNVLSVSYTNAGYLNRLLELGGMSETQLKLNVALRNQTLKDNSKKRERIVNYIKENYLDTKKPTLADAKVAVAQALRAEDKKMRDLVYYAKRGEENLFDFWIITSFLVAGLDDDDIPLPKAIVSPGRTGEVYADTIINLCKLTQQATIKTLPFFRQSHIYERSCFLYSVQNQIEGSINNDKSFNTIFTGRYTILGVRHYISADSAFSKFDLKRLDLIGENSKFIESDTTLTVNDFQPSYTLDASGNPIWNK